jgi:hypothetical protein
MHKPSRSRQRLQQYGIPNPTGIRYSEGCAVVVVEGAAVRPMSRGITTMIIIGIVLSFVGLGFLCWLLFTLAVYALPVFAAIATSLAAYHSGSGAIGAILVGFIAGAVTVAAGNIAVATACSPLVRAAVALLFAVPAAIAGFYATLGLANIGVPAEGWRQAFALIGAIVVGATAWVRMAVVTPPHDGQDAVAGSAQLPLASATEDG